MGARILETNSSTYDLLKQTAMSSNALRELANAFLQRFLVDGGAFDEKLSAARGLVRVDKREDGTPRLRLLQRDVTYGYGLVWRSGELAGRITFELPNPGDEPDLLLELLFNRRGLATFDSTAPVFPYSLTEHMADTAARATELLVLNMLSRLQEAGVSAQ